MAKKGYSLPRKALVASTLAASMAASCASTEIRDAHLFTGYHSEQGLTADLKTNLSAGPFRYHDRSIINGGRNGEDRSNYSGRHAFGIGLGSGFEAIVEGTTNRDGLIEDGFLYGGRVNILPGSPEDWASLTIGKNDQARFAFNLEKWWGTSFSTGLYHETRRGRRDASQEEPNIMNPRGSSTERFEKSLSELTFEYKPWDRLSFFARVDIPDFEVGHADFFTGVSWDLLNRTD